MSDIAYHVFYLTDSRVVEERGLTLASLQKLVLSQSLVILTVRLMVE